MRAGLYPAAPKSRYFLDEAPLQLSLKLRLPATPETVFSILVNQQAWPQWCTLVRECHFTSGQAGGVGACCLVDAGFFRAEGHSLVWQPGHAWYFTVTASSLKSLRALGVDVHLRADGQDATLMCWRYAGVLSSRARPLGWLMRLVLGSLTRIFLCQLSSHLRTHG